MSAREGRQDARGLFARLSGQAPVHWDPYAGTWLVSGRAEVARVCSGEEYSAVRLSALGRTAAPGAAVGVREQVGDMLARQALFLDGAAHTAWARVIRRALAPARIDALAPWILHRVGELAGAGGHRHLDVATDLARPLPLEVIARLFGLPGADLPALRAWSDAYTRIVTGIAPETDPGVYDQLAEFTDYARDLIRHRRAAPGPDSLSALIAGTDATVAADDTDIAANLLMLIAAGHQTTTGFLAGAVLERVRPSWGPLREDLSREDEVEELLTRVSPSRFVGRTVTKDTELGGQRLRAGQSVVVLLAAANWSALTDRANANSAGPARHSAFGHGRHRCPGARLARLEGKLVLDHLFGTGRHPTLSRPTVPWSDNVNLPCPLHVPLSLDAPASKKAPHDVGQGPPGHAPRRSPQHLRGRHD
ncbi:cytochrome P450 [Streptomyces sp. RKAG337]|uniref:cytochrome P450 n=1 Tax=Streptomyces sp. RKAG337 TaxID=2893404 RepID=UPI002033F205|nr:cytochrome P450 [Streptomyces sp. RKAG337]MCM2425079.1 cytochrome P450 [Streptomyces sp. RKAG337]